MPEFRAVPILTWSVPERSEPSNLTSQEVTRLLTIKARRGRMIMLSIAVFGALACGFFAVMQHAIPWAVVSGMTATFGLYCHLRLGEKVALASRLVADPRLVFWIHPTVLQQQVGGQTLETPFITLHSKDAGTFEVAMPMDLLVAITHWYQEQNPAVRVGSFDKESA